MKRLFVIIFILIFSVFFIGGASASEEVTNGGFETSDFTGWSTNTPTSWYWDFGDGNTSSSQNPVHEYAYAGTFTISLNATNAAGSDIEAKSDYITVSEPATPTPTATSTTTVTPTPTATTTTSTPTPSIPTYSGIHITDTDGITASHATLNGYVDSSGNDPIVWFKIGTSSGTYAYKTTNISSGAGTFSATIESYPLIAGVTYYARAVSANGASEEEVSWTMSDVSSFPTSSFGNRANNFMDSNMSVLVFADAITNQGGDIFGGGDTGIAIFVSLVVSIAFIVLFGRAGDVIIPLEVGILVIGFIVAGLAPEFASLGYGLMVAAVIGVVYSLFRKSR